jgi:hypothetical protein
MIDLCSDNFPPHPKMVLICDIDVTTSITVRLTVSPCTPDAWAWTFLLHTGETIARGKTVTRLAAQIASQRAHEHWLHLNRRRLGIPARFSYHWKDVG